MKILDFESDKVRNDILDNKAYENESIVKLGIHEHSTLSYTSNIPTFNKINLDYRK